MSITDRYVTVGAAGGGDGSSGSPWTWAEMLTNAAAGDRVNIQAGSYSRSTNADALTNSGTSTQPIILRGYLTAPGDGYQGRSNDGKGSLIATHMPTITYTTGRLNLSARSYVVLESLNVAASALDDEVLDLGGTMIVKSCIVTNAHGGSSANGIKFGGSNGAAIDCDVSSTNATSRAAIEILASGVRVIGCRLRSVGGAGVLANANRSTIAQSVIYGSVDGIKGLSSASAWECTAIANTIYGCTTGINMPSATVSQIAVLVSNLIANCTTALAVGTDGPVICANNRYVGNTAVSSTITDWFTGLNYHANTTAGNDFRDAAGNDFRLSTDSPARKAGHAYRDIGGLTYQGANLTELTGPPNSAACSLEDAVMWLLMQSVNRRDTEEGTDGDVVYNAAGSAIAEADTSDNGTTFTRAKYASA